MSLLTYQLEDKHLECEQLKEENKRLKAMLKEIYLKCDASTLPSRIVHQLGMEFYQPKRGLKE